MPKAENRKPGQHVLGRTQRSRLRDLAADKGTAGAAALVGIHPQTYAGLVAGLPAHASTVALIERRLAELAEANDG
jgi:hypothetical protein